RVPAKRVVVLYWQTLIDGNQEINPEPAGPHSAEDRRNRARIAPGNEQTPPGGAVTAPPSDAGGALPACLSATASRWGWSRRRRWAGGSMGSAGATRPSAAP